MKGTLNGGIGGCSSSWIRVVLVNGGDPCTVLLPATLYCARTAGMYMHVHALQVQKVPHIDGVHILGAYEHAYLCIYKDSPPARLHERGCMRLDKGSSFFRPPGIDGVRFQARAQLQREQTEDCRGQVLYSSTDDCAAHMGLTTGMNERHSCSRGRARPVHDGPVSTIRETFMPYNYR